MKGIPREQHVDLDQLRNEMFAELRQLQNVLNSIEYRWQPYPHRNITDNSPRNFKAISELLVSLGLTIDVNQKNSIISKSNGNFIINLINGTVKFTPKICLECHEQASCKYSRRKLCIVEESDGICWANITVSKIDMLILAKIVAILYDLLPNHVLNQIKSLSDCFNKKPKIKTLENTVIREIRRIFDEGHPGNYSFPNAPPIQGPIPPPEFTKPHLRFTPPPQQIKENLKSPNMIQLRSSILRELKRLQQLMELSKKLSNSPITY